MSQCVLKKSFGKVFLKFSESNFKIFPPTHTHTPTHTPTHNALSRHFKTAQPIFFLSDDVSMSGVFCWNPEGAFFKMAAIYVGKITKYTNEMQG